MNMYFNFTLPAVTGSLIDAIPYNRTMVEVSLGFDMLPAASKIVDGTLTFDVSEGSLSHVNVNLDSSSSGDYKAGEQVAFMMNASNNALVTMNVNGRGTRPVVFDFYGGATSGDLKDGVIYTAVFDDNRFHVLEMSTRSLTDIEKRVIESYKNLAVYNAKAFGGAAVGSVEFFPNGTNPESQYPMTTWEQLSESVATLTNNVVSSNDLTAWIRRS